MVGTGGFGDPWSEGPARTRLIARRQFGDHPEPLRIAQRVQDGGDVEGVPIGVFKAHTRNHTTIIELCGTVIIEL
jgi:hypothetical protein